MSSKAVHLLDALLLLLLLLLLLMEHCLDVPLLLGVELGAPRQLGEPAWLGLGLGLG